MLKIPTVFVRDPENRRYVLPEVTPGCEWVMRGEGVATRKYDGICVLIQLEDGAPRALARRMVKEGKPAPPVFYEIGRDDATGTVVGWEPAEQSGFGKWIAEALANMAEVNASPHPGTYELVGPKIQQNPEQCPEHWLFEHVTAERMGAYDHPTGYDELATYLPAFKWEGIVWHHPDGRMAKIKRRDFLKVEVA